MRKNIKLLGTAGALLLAITAAGLARSADPGLPPGSDGSNAGGAERVCGNGAAKTFNDTYASCKRGDVIGLGRATPQGVMSVCDFSKTILYAQGEAIACVYIGSIRQAVK
ncbi:hypothetical protein [Roseateles flavus]|uniref:Secreted protein n=1 Tax=Roseateles flavus TaxID=3149041 RepID=A0ABV0GK96_9BURK